MRTMSTTAAAGLLLGLYAQSSCALDSTEDGLLLCADRCLTSTVQCEGSALDCICMQQQQWTSSRIPDHLLSCISSCDLPLSTPFDTLSSNLYSFLSTYCQPSSTPSPSPSLSPSPTPSDDTPAELRKRSIAGLPTAIPTADLGAFPTPIASAAGLVATAAIPAVTAATGAPNSQQQNAEENAIASELAVSSPVVVNGMGMPTALSSSAATTSTGSSSSKTTQGGQGTMLDVSGSTAATVKSPVAVLVLGAVSAMCYILL